MSKPDGRFFNWIFAHIQIVIVLTLLGLFVLVGVFSVRYSARTYDEGDHYAYGMKILNGSSTRFDDSKMPFSALNALPKRIAGLIPVSLISKVLSKFIVARFVTIIFSTLVALLVFHWSRSLYGFIPALASLVLYILDPNILAHSQLVTTDIYAVGTITLTFYCLWRFAHQRTFLNGMVCAFAIGLSQLAKYTGIVLLPLCILACAMYDLPALISSASRHAAWRIKDFILRYLLYGSAAILVSIVIINMGFLFNQTFLRFGQYNFKSDLFQTIQEKAPVLRAVPVPVPYPYLQGLDWVVERERTGDGYGRIYLLGVLHKGQGFPGYFFIASLFKVPIATQITCLAAIIVYLLDRKRNRRFLSDELFFCVPIAFFAIYFNFFYNAQIGIRYYLVIFPLLYIFTGNLFSRFRSFSPFFKTSTIILLAYLVISVFSYYPYYLSYFNELVWNRAEAYKVLADSNLDWGQSEIYLQRYLSIHPDTIFKPQFPRSGRVVVGVNSLVGIENSPDEFAWLRNNFEPAGTIAYSYLVYQISPQDLSSMCAKTDYCNR
jgi:hypothetical protein